MINKIIKVNSKYEERVRSFIEKQNLYIKINLPTINVGELVNWKVNKKLSRTEDVYLHSLLIIKDLIQFNLSNKEGYSKLAHDIIINWWEENKDNKVAWHEHAVSERVLNFIYFQENSSKKIKNEVFKSILDKHLEYLFESSNYKKNNHGLMMDRSLLIGGHYTNNQVYIDKAIDRFTTFIYRDFSPAGIHLENSPEYHNLAMIIMKEFIEVMKLLNITIDEYIQTIMKKANTYLQFLSRPDGTVPMLGDSSLRKLQRDKYYSIISDHVSGVFLYQENYHKNWLLCSNGYQRITHKHKDDMSVQFSIDKLNILVDSGKYNYDNDSEIRKYIISDKAHSKPFILERRFKYDNPDRLKTNIVLNQSDIYHVEMSYDVKNDFHILRNVILHKETSALFIIDRFASKEKLTYISNFVLNPELEINISKNKIAFPKEKVSLNSTNKFVLRSKEDDKFNWYSKEFNQYEKTNRVFIRSSGNYREHIAIINKDPISTSARIDNTKIIFEINEQQYNVDISKIQRWRTT